MLTQPAAFEIKSKAVISQLLSLYRRHLRACCVTRYADTWLAWVSMERSLRQIPAARAVFKRCFNRKMEADGQLALAMQWLRFEREEGR